MKVLNKFSLICVCTTGLLVASCADLDVVPEGSTFTQSQKDELMRDPSKLQGDVNGLYSGLIEYGSITSWMGATQHYDFGYAAACMMYDATGMDVPSEYSGYNWFYHNMRYTDRTATAAHTYFMWKMYYSHIKTANDLIGIIPTDTDDRTLLAFLGQAYASRAFDYLHLVQMYQFTYKGHENEPAVPIVTEATTVDKATNNPRATVQEVYDLIISDLTKAIDCLEGYSRSGKEIINQNVAYALRARANLVMGNWAAAAADADKALVGYTPYSIKDVSKPTFNNISASSWIWGNAISENNSVVKSGLLNFPSHMCSFTGNGYAPGYAGRYINNKLYDRISDTDVRKGWWLNAEMDSPNVDWDWTTTYNGKEYGVAQWFGFAAPYLNVKFGAYQDVYNNATNACDFPLIRAEEMYLIKAEGLAMSGSDGKSVLENFVRTYRDPAYVCNAASATEIQDEIWFQRRIELWGEGHSFFDMQRLKKPLSRVGTNFASAVTYDLPAESQIFLWLIPEDEMNVNKALVNNPVATVPAP